MWICRYVVTEYLRIHQFLGVALKWQGILQLSQKVYPRHLSNQRQNTFTLNLHIIILSHFQGVMQSAALMTALIPKSANLRALIYTGNSLA